MTTDKKNDARKLDHATLEVMRLRAIEVTKAGMKADRSDSRLRRASPHGLSLADYYKGGEQAPEATPITDRPPKLDEPQMQSLAQAVTDRTQLQHGFEVGLLMLSILRELIRTPVWPHHVLVPSVSRVNVAAGHHGA